MNAAFPRWDRLSASFLGMGEGWEIVRLGNELC